MIGYTLYSAMANGVGRLG